MNVNSCILKLKKIVKDNVNNHNYDVALTAAKLLSSIYYDYNQIYTDQELEDKLLIIRDNILNKQEYDTDKKSVFFYDGFGLDLRGWAASYVRALSGLGYFVIYSCPKSQEGKIPHIISELNSDSSEVIYIDNKSKMIDKTKYIDFIFKKYKPCTAFFYTTPWDVEAAIAFSNNKSTTKIQIDLTDHAYWIGTNAFDYILESREMGASLALFQRGVAREKIIKNDCVPYINNDICDTGLPFDITKEEYIFTGGSLYKTLGDKNLLYYKTVRHILDKFKNIIFLYAGSGDSSEIEKLQIDYPQRVYIINEVSYFFELIKNCILYINSYPMFGGLMMRYAALANKVPITLKHDNDSDGLLINQDSLGIEFENYDEYISEIDKLLLDEVYRHEKEILLRNSVYDEKMFADELELIIKEHKSKTKFEKINEYDTSKFRREYKNRYNKNRLYESIANKNNICLIKYFPKEFAIRCILKLKEKLLQ